MKAIVTVTTLLMVLALGAQAFAQLDPDDDGIGVYFDPCACVNCLPMDVGPQTGWVVITHPTAQQGGVGGWEAMIWVEGPAVVTGATFYGDATSFLPPPQYYVGCATPLYNPFTYPAVVVAKLDFQIFDTATPVNWFIHGVYPHSLPDRVPAYLDGDDYEIIIPLQQPTGGPDIPVATINGECAVEGEDATWGGVKSLFR